jgi:hypothetical protein
MHNHRFTQMSSHRSLDLQDWSMPTKTPPLQVLSTCSSLCPVRPLINLKEATSVPQQFSSAVVIKHKTWSFLLEMEKESFKQTTSLMYVGNIVLLSSPPQKPSRVPATYHSRSWGLAIPNKNTLFSGYLKKLLWFNATANQFSCPKHDKQSFSPRLQVIFSKLVCETFILAKL